MPARHADLQLLPDEHLVDASALRLRPGGPYLMLCWLA